jgi:hypothetical protein
MNLYWLMRKAALSYQTIEIDTTDFDVAIPETLLGAKSNYYSF